MRKALLLAFGAMSLATTAMAVHKNQSSTLLFSSRVNGAQVVPATASLGVGVFAASLNKTRDSIYYELTVAKVGTITSVEIRNGAPGTNGTLVDDITSDLVRGGHFKGTWSKQAGTLTDAMIAQMIHGDYYVSVNTSANPNGVVRGQIAPEVDPSFHAVATAAKLVPTNTTNPAARAIIWANVAQNLSKIDIHITASRLKGAITSVGLYTGTNTQNGVLTQNLTDSLRGSNTNTVIYTLNNPSISLLTSFRAGTAYIKINTDSFPSGEVRSQLSGPVALYMDAALDTPQLVPAVVGAINPLGTAIFNLSSDFDTFYYFINGSGLSGNVLALTLRIAEFGQNGPGIFTLPVTNDSLKGVRSFFASGTITGASLRAGFIDSLLMGYIYINATTSQNFRELRGQIFRTWRDGLRATPSGFEENPQRLASKSYGTGIVSIDRDNTNAHIMVAFDSLATPASAGHIHFGGPGVNGPVVFPLNPFFDNMANPNAAYAYWTKTSLPTAFSQSYSVRAKRDSLYFNFHNATFPSGEARGNIRYGRRVNFTPDLSIDTTNVLDAYCGRTFGLQGDRIGAEPANGAQRYRFQFSNPTTGAVVDAFNSKSRSGAQYAEINKGPGSGATSKGLQYGQTYLVRVAAFSGGMLAAYGSPCVVYTSDTPAQLLATKIRTQDCGRTINPTNGYIIADKVLGATGPGLSGYTFTIGTDSMDVVNNMGSATQTTVGRQRLDLASLGLLTGITYFARANAIVDGVTTPDGPVCSFITDTAAGARLGAIAIGVYPNPSSSNFTIEAAEGALLEVSDMSGRIVERRTLVAGNTVFGANLAVGTYTARIATENTVETMRLVKTN